MVKRVAIIREAQVPARAQLGCGDLSFGVSGLQRRAVDADVAPVRNRQLVGAERRLDRPRAWGVGIEERQPQCRGGVFLRPLVDRMADPDAAPAARACRLEVVALVVAGVPADAREPRRASHAGQSIRRRPSAPVIPLLQLLGHGAHRVAALVPARPRPDLEVQVACGRVPRLADAADRLAGVDACALPGAPPLEVHVDVVAGVGPRVDHDVVAGAARLVGPVLHPAALRRDDALAALGEDVLALMYVTGPRGAVAVAVGVAGTHRELRRIELDRAVAAVGLGPRAVDVSVALRPDAEQVGTLARGLALVCDAVPAHLVGPRLDVVAPPDLDGLPVLALDRLDLQVLRAVAVEGERVGDALIAICERLARVGGLRDQAHAATAAAGGGRRAARCRAVVRRRRTGRGR